MTNTQKFPSDEREPFVTIPVSLLQYVRQRKLTGLQYELWLYLYELDPYGKRWIDVPPPEEIAIALHCDHRTVQRAAVKLQDCGLFDFEIKAWRTRNTTAIGSFPQNSTGKGIQMPTNGSKNPTLDQTIQTPTNGSHCGQTDPNVDPEPAQGGSFKNGNVPNRSNRSFKTTRTETPTTHPVFAELDREELGTGSQDPLEQEVSALMQLVQEAEIRPNGTIQETIVSLVFQEGSAAARRTVENSISAVIEQRNKGNCRNPGGMLIAGLRRGFTANAAKRKARERQEPKPEPPNIAQISIAIDHALLNDDRPFALWKLQELWSAGWHDQLEELLLLRKDWQFRLTTQGVQDANAT
ncbi:MAG: hypothetical protein HC866_19630 [Leptolyngbyaceae cyanobacterium RU_5_1]|nr:hypothetical protein [Leptolyngbyaceae cyanobacterium RU_5_1]